MANYYTLFSFELSLDTDGHRAWAEGAIAYLESVWDESHEPVETDEFYALTGGDVDSLRGNRFGIEIVDDRKGLWLNSDEGSVPDAVIPLVQAYLAKFDPDGFEGFEWANTCSSMRLDSFGGGAVLITANDVKFYSSGQWLHEQMAARQ